MKNKLNDKKIQFKLPPAWDYDSFKILRDWGNQARKEGWTEEEIFTVLDEATLYNRKEMVNLLQLYSQ